MTELDLLLNEITEELERARSKFPKSRATMVALMEEVGELAKAMMDESAENVRNEAIQVAVMAIRTALDGDRSLDILRDDHGLDPVGTPAF